MKVEDDPNRYIIYNNIELISDMSIAESQESKKGLPQTLKAIGFILGGKG
jgi:hypothetical protein